MSIDDLIQLKPEDHRDRDVSSEEILDWFRALDAYWVHSGDSKDPHAKLTSGKCSNGFFKCMSVLKYVNLSEILAFQLARKIRAEIGDLKIDWVIASPMSGITFGHDVARAIGATKFFFTEKDPINEGKMLWNRELIPEGESVLQIEELITTAKTLNSVQEAVNAGTPTPVNWVPYIGVFVHRPEKLPVEYYGDRKLVSIIEKEIWAVEPSRCILCSLGSPRFAPKKLIQ